MQASESLRSAREQRKGCCPALPCRDVPTVPDACSGKEQCQKNGGMPCSPAGSADGTLQAAEQASCVHGEQMSARIAALEAEVAAQRLATEAAWHAHSALRSQLESSIQHSPCTSNLYDSAASPPAGLQPDGQENRQKGQNSGDGLQLLSGTVGRHEADRGDPQLATPTAALPWKAVRGDVGTTAALVTHHMVSPVQAQQQTSSASTPPVQIGNGACEHDSGDSIKALLLGMDRLQATPRRATTLSPAHRDRHCLPSICPGTRLSPVLLEMPAHMRRFAPPSILAALASGDSPACPGISGNSARCTPLRSPTGPDAVVQAVRPAQLLRFGCDGGLCAGT